MEKDDEAFYGVRDRWTHSHLDAFGSGYETRCIDFSMNVFEEYYENTIQRSDL